MTDVHLLCGQKAGRPLIGNGNKTCFPIVHKDPAQDSVGL